MSRSDFHVLAQDTYNEYVERECTVNDDTGEVVNAVEQRFRFIHHYKDGALEEASDFQRILTDLVDMIASDEHSMRVLGRAIDREMLNYIAAQGLSLKTFEVARYCEVDVMDNNYRIVRTAEAASNLGMDILRMQLKLLLDTFTPIVREAYNAYCIEDEGEAA